MARRRSRPLGRLFQIGNTRHRWRRQDHQGELRNSNSPTARSPHPPMHATTHSSTHLNKFLSSIQFWHVSRDEEGTPSVQFLSNHRGLSHAVNAIRFSPCGKKSPTTVKTPLSSPLCLPFKHSISLQLTPLLNLSLSSLPFIPFP